MGRLCCVEHVVSVEDRKEEEARKGWIMMDIDKAGIRYMQGIKFTKKEWTGAVNQKGIISTLPFGFQIKSCLDA